MAAVSGRHITGASGMGAGTGPAEAGLWSHAVPMEENENDTMESDPALASQQALAQQFESANPLNGAPRPKGRKQYKTTPAVDPQLQPSTMHKSSSRQLDQIDSGTGVNDSDAHLNLYRPSKEQLRGASRDRQRVKRKASLGGASVLSETNHQEEDLESKWIHRDKLAQIESRELAEMGLQIGIPTRTGSRAGKKASKAPSIDLEEEPQEEQYPMPDMKRARTSSPTEANNEAYEDNLVQTVTSDDDGILPRVSSPTSKAHQRRRPSASKIPVQKNSSLAETASSPPPSSPSQRIARARSASQTSQNLLDTPKETSQSTFANSSGDGTTPLTGSPGASPQDSPTKGRFPIKITPQSAASKVQRGGRSVSGSARPGTSSSPATENSPRPGSSAGRRPPTAKPEGEPPWISSMFKPDPMLPPDQQMLPTHAKRLAEQQMKEDVDRQETQAQDSEYVLLDNEDTVYGDQSHSRSAQMGYTIHEATTQSRQSMNDSASVRSRQQDAYVRQEGRASPYNPEGSETGQWPLRTASMKEQNGQSIPSPRSETGTFATSQSQTGGPTLESGYSLMPTIQSPREIETRLSQRSGLSNQISATHNTAQATRVPEDPPETEKEAKKKACACCIVM